MAEQEERKQMYYADLGDFMLLIHPVPQDIPGEVLMEP